jgi:DNA polymerase IV (archaeal DinB-like DNA polymerase)
MRRLLNRVICHLDLDYFYAQIEEVENPSLKLLPVLVCVYSGRTAESGVVSTANYKAREHGIKSGMPIVLAKRRLAQTEAVFIPMKHEKYEAYSERIMSSLRGEVDVLEQAGIDEAFFDITKRTGGDYGLAAASALEIKAKIFNEEKLTCSVGVGPNKVVAKIASDFKKPDGLTIVKPDEALSFLSPLPVEKIYGVGPKTARLLEEEQIKTIGGLAGAPIEKLEDLLGKKLAVYLYKAANGSEDESVVDERAGSTQLSRMITLKSDTRDLDQILAQLTPAIKDLDDRLISRNVFFRTISVMGILHDLSIRTKSRTIETPTNDYSVLEREAKDLLRLLLAEVGGGLRRAGVRASDLENMVDQSSLNEFLT